MPYPPVQVLESLALFEVTSDLGTDLKRPSWREQRTKSFRRFRILKIAKCYERLVSLVIVNETRPKKKNMKKSKKKKVNET